MSEQKYKWSTRIFFVLLTYCYLNKIQQQEKMHNADLKCTFNEFFNACQRNWIIIPIFLSLCIPTCLYVCICMYAAAMGVPVILQHIPLWDCVRWLLGSVYAGCHRHSRGHAVGWWGHANRYFLMSSKINPPIHIHSILRSVECQGRQLTWLTW